MLGSSSRQRFRKSRNSGDHLSELCTVGEGEVWIISSAYVSF